MGITRDDVAVEAGVSPAVVSFVMNNSPRAVAPATRQKVLDAASRLGYRRNTLARAMRLGRTNSIGLVLPNFTPSYFARLTEEITDEAQVHGLTVQLANSRNSLEVERQQVEDLAGRQVDALIVIRVDPASDPAWLRTLGVPVLLLDNLFSAVEEEAAATTHLLDHGRRRIARVSGPLDFSYIGQRDDGWSEAITARGLTPDADRLLVRAALNEQGGYDAALQLLRLPEPPDGVVIDTGMQAVGFLRGAADVGKTVPHDIAVVAHDLGMRADFTIPRLTSIDSPLPEIATRAVDVIRQAQQADGLLAIGAHKLHLTPRESCGHSAHR